MIKFLLVGIFLMLFTGGCTTVSKNKEGIMQVNGCQKTDRRSSGDYAYDHVTYGAYVTCTRNNISEKFHIVYWNDYSAYHKDKLLVNSIPKGSYEVAFFRRKVNCLDQGNTVYKSFPDDGKFHPILQPSSSRINYACVKFKSQVLGGSLLWGADLNAITYTEPQLWEN